MQSRWTVALDVTVDRFQRVWRWYGERFKSGVDAGRVVECVVGS